MFLNKVIIGAYYHACIIYIYTVKKSRAYTVIQISLPRKACTCVLFSDGYTD